MLDVHARSADNGAVPKAALSPRATLVKVAMKCRLRVATRSILPEQWRLYPEDDRRIFDLTHVSDRLVINNFDH